MRKSQKAKNDLFLDVFIERIVPGGAGLAFAEGLTIFVPLTAPGDKARVRVSEKKKQVAFAELVQVLEPAPARQTPPCPHFGNCGGCDFQQLNYSAQLAAKVEIIRDSLRRIGKINWQAEIPIVPSPDVLNYRTRAQWKRDRQTGALGYFRRNTHTVFEVETCPILSPALEKTLFELKAKQNAFFTEAQAVSSNAEVSLRFVKNEKLSDFDENFYAANKDFAEQTRAEAGENQKSAKEISLKIGEFEYRFSADTFFQVNHALLPEFITAALKDFAGKAALDLYCGVGLFSLPLAKKFETVAGIEGNAASIEFARKNAASAEIENAQFETALVSEWLKKEEKKLQEIDFVLLDPPRTGTEKETVEILARLKPARISYVSCNPATLARDLARLQDGYKIEKIEAFDFFPQTHHVETIVHLKLSSDS